MCGVAVAIYGAVILLTGRLARDRRAFGRTEDAGLYYACFGLAPTLLVLSTVCNQHGQSLLAAVALVGTMALVGLAVHFRPRQGKHR